MAKKVFHIVVDEKVTIWRRNVVEVRDCDTLEEAQKKLIGILKKDDGTWADDVIDEEILFDTEESMSVGDNYGRCTIEVLDDNKYKTIWTNADTD